MEPKERKLLYLIGSKDPGGAEKVLFELALSFQLKGYDVTVGHLGNWWLGNELRKHNIKDVFFPFANLYHSHRTELIFVLNLMRFIKAHGFDLIHAHLFGMILYSSFIGRILGIPVVGTVHDKYYFTEKEHRRLAYRVTQMLGCRLVSVSKDIRDNLALKWGIREDKIDVLYNGIGLGKFCVRLDKSAKRKEVGLGMEDIVVISVGRLVKMKGHSILISAGRNIVSQNKKVKFLMVGDGSDKQELERMAAAEGISENIIFAGHREDVPELLLMSDIFAQTSLTEGLSCTVMEALAAGCPLVVTDVGGNREIIRDAREGYLVPITDQKALEQKILALARDKELRRELGKNAKEAAKNFSLDLMIKNYEHLYLRLLDSEI